MFPRVATFRWCVVGIVVCLAGAAVAAITPEQRKEADAIKAEVDKAGKLFQQKKFQEAGEAIKGAQEKLDRYAADADAAALKLLEPTLKRLKTAHGLLELEGVTLPPLGDYSAKGKPEKPTPGKPEKPEPAGAGGVSFVKEVAPLIVARCGNCHVTAARGRFSMADYTALMRGNNDGKVVFPGNDTGSRIIEVIESGDMPRGGGKVAPAELAMLKKWIKEGAKYDGKDPAAKLTELAPDAKADKPVTVAVTAATGKETISFSKDIAPILADTCYNCHGGGQQTRANFNLLNVNNLFKGGDSGSPIAPSKGSESLLVKKLKGTAEGARMPQNLPPLSDDLIAKVQKWIDEGARYDAGDPAMNVKQVAALAKANAATHEELVAERVTMAAEKWRLGLPGIESIKVESKNFYVMGNTPQATIDQVSQKAESIVPRIATIFKAPADKPLFKGRMTIFVVGQRYDYAEFSNMVEKRELPKNLRGHFRANPVDVYGVVNPGKADEYAIEPLLGQIVAGSYAANLGKGTPHWFAEGVGRAVAAKLAVNDPRVDQWDNELPRVIASMKQPSEFIEGKLNPEDGDIASYSFARWLMTETRRFDTLLTALKKNQDFDPSFVAAYGGTPTQLSATWSVKGAIVKKPKK